MCKQIIYCCPHCLGYKYSTFVSCSKSDCSGTDEEQVPMGGICSHMWGPQKQSGELSSPAGFGGDILNYDVLKSSAKEGGDN